MNSTKFDGVDFNNDWAASIDEAAFIESMIDVVAYPWRKSTPIERENKLKEAYKIIINANSSGASKKTTGGGSANSNGGRNNRQSPDDSKPVSYTHLTLPTTTYV